MSEVSSPGNLFCFGMGFSAQALANRLIIKGWVVSGTYRNNKSTKSLKNSLSMPIK